MLFAVDAGGVMILFEGMKGVVSWAKILLLPLVEGCLAADGVSESPNTIDDLWTPPNLRPPVAGCAAAGLEASPRSGDGLAGVTGGVTAS
ncbi:hypothetical protein BDR26DRAFT_849021 [Obelidium mucronatum]|nr:hypothetical protein BDR26DRAFT_849021 [Obelidium mucronatum]